MRFFSRPVKEVFAEFPAIESRLPDIRGFIETTLQETPFRRKDITAIMLAIEEACTNVIRHAYLYADGTIKLKVTLHADRLAISIFDTGRSFDFQKSSDPDLKHYIKTGRKGGLGLYLIRKVTDDVTYSSSGGVNELRMIKRFPKTRPTAVPRAEGMSIRLKFSLATSIIMMAVIVMVYFYWENRVVEWRQQQFAGTISEYGNAIASQAVSYFINSSSDVEFDEFVRNFAKQNPDVRYIFIVDNKGRIVASTGDPQKLHTQYVPPNGIDKDRLNIAQKVRGDSAGNVYHVVESISYLGHAFGKLHVGFGEQRLESGIAASRRSIMFVVALAMLFVLTAVYYLSNYFVKPIQKLIEGVRRIGKGDLEGKIAVEGADEFSAIAHAFNEMTDKFKEAQTNVVEQERMRKEMQVAQDIQHTLLPKHFPDIEGFDISTIYRAAKDVGGDYYDFVWIDEKTLGIVVADVSGKGVPGSLVMTMIRTAIRLESRGTRSPVDILTSVNDFVTEDVRKGMFITIFLVVIDTQKRTISFASAGHNPMVLYRKDEDKTFFLNPKGIPLGITLPEGISFEDNLTSETVRLKRGDMLVIYTDGITEAMNPRNEQFGMPRFLEFIRDNADLSPEDFIEKFGDELHSFTRGAEQNDDITMVAIKEKIEIDEVLFARRKKLLELVDQEGKSVQEACRLMNLSSSTYYRYRKRFELYGEEGLLNKRLRIDDSPVQMTYEQRNRVLDIVRENPEFGPTRIKRELDERNHDEELDERTIYNELVRLRLNTRRQRYDYAQRQGLQLSPEQQEDFRKSIAEAEPKAVSRGEYLEQIKESLQQKEDEREEKIRDRVAEIGLSQEKSEILTAMFAEMEGQLTADQLKLIVQKVVSRVTEIDAEEESKNVFSTAHLDSVGDEKWQQRAEEGLTLEVMSVPEEVSEGMDFAEYEKKLLGEEDEDRGNRTDAEDRKDTKDNE
jgi:serine phosphatase RsbU (regulator of sigma subunit)/anti-sigma regulatory factor (Ser/Thr protein kinase)/transposase